MKKYQKYPLSKKWIDYVVHNIEEFANGGAQVQIETEDGKIYKKVLISNCTWIIAIEGYRDLPFKMENIRKIFQSEEDKNPPRPLPDWELFK